MTVRMPELREREIFRDLICHPNKVPRPDGAHAAVAERYGLTLDVVKAIERKGMARDWPPLD